MLEQIADRLKELGVIMPVDRALVHDELAVNILAVDHISVAVKLIGMPLCAEGDEHRERTEVIYMVENIEKCICTI